MDCLEDKRENYQKYVLCCVRQLCTMIRTHIYEQFLKMSVELGLGLDFVRLFRVSILGVFWFSSGYFVLVLFAFVVLG